MSDDYAANAQTTGTVAVGGSATGTIETPRDRDWFAVELVAGRTYVIDLRGSPTGDGTLRDPYLRGIYDADGNRISNTTDDDGGQSYNSRVTLTATESGTHYIAAGAYSSRQGTYEVEVTDTSPPETPQEQVQQQPPAFGSQFYAFELEENADGSANRLSLGTVSATDPDGGSVTYGIEAGNAAGLFEIDAASGELFYVGGGEDYETGSTRFELTVRATDGDQTTDTAVTVNVTDVDDPVEVDPPVTEPDQSTPQTVSEPAGEDFSRDSSTSGRVAVGETATGRIGSNGDRDWFAVELEAGRTYVIDLRGSPTDDGTLSDPYLRGVYDADGDRISGTLNNDAGTGRNSRVTFTATESGTHYIAAGAYSSRQGTYELEVTDTSSSETPQEQIQPQPPAFGSQSYAFELEENADGSANRLSLGTVSATDPDGGSVIYSIAGGNESGLFEIDAASGELFYVGAGEDYETGSTRFELTVRASDGDQANNATVTVIITDVGEAPAFGQAGYAFDLVEDTDGSANRISLGTVTATDPDGGSVAYSIEGGNAAGLFEIDAASGELFYVGGGEDYETGSTRFELTVRASDGDQTTDTAVTVNVTDVDEPVVVDPPVAQEAQSVPQTVSEPAGEDFARDSSTSGRVAVGDTATGRVGSNGDRDWFAVELVAGRTYVIDLRGSPTDDGTLRDPLLRGIYDADGSRISGTLNDDGGHGYNSRVTFTATESGTHYIAAGAYSGQGTYEVEVTDTSPPTEGQDADSEDPPDRQEQVQQQPPAFGSQFYAFDLAEGTDGSANRLSLGTVSATDPDGGSVTYTIAGGNAAGLFEIDAASGELFYVGAGEDYDTGSTSFNLTVRASDGDETTDATVTVNVTDVDEPVEIDPPVTEPDQSTAQTVSEPSGEDFPADPSTSGRVAVGGTATGRIGSDGDLDWFAVELEAGKTYRIETSGVPTGGGTLPRGSLHGVYDADGNRIPGVYDPSLSFLSINGQDVPQDDDEVFFTPDEDGTYYMAAGNGGTTDTGTYTLRVTEMQDDFPATVDTTGTVQVGGTASGEIEYETDWDWFAVELAAGQSYTIDLKGRSTNDGTLYSPYLRGIYDAEGNQIPGTTDFDGGSGYNSRLHFTAETGGTYYIAASSAYLSSLGTYEVEVWEDDFAASRETTGTLEVGGTASGEIQRAEDRDYFAVELEAGKTYQIDLGGVKTGVGTLQWPHLHAVYDADGISTGVRDAVIIAPTYFNGQQIFSGEDEQAFFTPEEDGTYYLVVGNFHSSNTGTYTVGVTEIEDDFPATVDTTGTVEVGGSATGEIQYETDHDWFAVELTAGETYKIELLGARGEGGTLRDPYIRGIHDADGRLIDDTTDYSSGPYSNSEVLFTPNEDGTYYIAAGSYMTGYREEDVGTYTLQVSNDDFRGDTDTTGTVDVGGSVTGEIEAQGDEDWFAVTLEAGRTYQIDLEGSATHAGTLENPFLRTMRDADGNYLELASGIQNIFTADRDSGEGLNSRVTFTPDENGTYYLVAASGGPVGSADSHGRSLGTYTLSVTDTSPLETSQEQVQQQPVEVDPPVAQTVSEPAGQDFARNSSTSGRVAVGDTATGRIGSSGDRDWFAVELVAERTYVIDLRGSPTDDGTLRDPLLHGVYDADGNRMSGTLNDDGGQGYNSRVTFTATESGIHYIAAGAYSGQGTYEVEVTDTSPPTEGQDADSEDPPDSQEQVQQQSPAFGSQFYAFELEENADGSANRVSLGTVTATDPDGGSVTYSIEGGNAAGLFGIDAASGELFYTGGGEDYEAGSTSFNLTVRASDGDQTTDATVTVIITDVAEAPAFGQAGYAFDLVEETDGSADRISLGTVTATDPDGGSVTYSIEGGNASRGGSRSTRPAASCSTWAGARTTTPAPLHST